MFKFNFLHLLPDLMNFDNLQLWSEVPSFQILYIGYSLASFITLSLYRTAVKWKIFQAVSAQVKMTKLRFCFQADKINK